MPEEEQKERGEESQCDGWLRKSYKETRGERSADLRPREGTVDHPINCLAEKGIAPGFKIQLKG